MIRISKICSYYTRMIYLSCFVDHPFCSCLEDAKRHGNIFYYTFEIKVNGNWDYYEVYLPFPLSSTDELIEWDGKSWLRAKIIHFSKVIHLSSSSYFFCDVHSGWIMASAGRVFFLQFSLHHYQLSFYRRFVMSKNGKVNLFISPLLMMNKWKRFQVKKKLFIDFSSPHRTLISLYSKLHRMMMLFIHIQTTTKSAIHSSPTSSRMMSQRGMMMMHRKLT